MLNAFYPVWVNVKGKTVFFVETLFKMYERSPPVCTVKSLKNYFCKLSSSSDSTLWTWNGGLQAIKRCWWATITLTERSLVFAIGSKPLVMQPPSDLMYEDRNPSINPVHLIYTIVVLCTCVMIMFCGFLGPVLLFWSLDCFHCFCVLPVLLLHPHLLPWCLIPVSLPLCIAIGFPIVFCQLTNV